MMITQVISQNGPVKIRKVGLVRSQDMLTGLAEMGVLTVEIDTEQSIEIEPEEVPTSMTQKLLQGEFDHAQSVDNTLSEQFNRSLFLPSVNELPSMWQLHARQVGLACAVVIVGLGLGFTAAIAPSWFTSANLQASTSSATQPLAVDPSQAQAPEETETQTTAQEVLPTEQVSKLSSGAAEGDKSHSPEDEGLTSSQQETMIAADIDTGSEAQTDDTEEGRVLNSPEDETEPLDGVSAELLARFNQALEDIESEPQDGQNETRVTVRDDLPRVDQLPARVLTRLPAMSFSAHMYASARQNRWVRANGQQVYEGDWINDQVQLVNIEPQRVVLSFEGELFTMAALTDW